MAQHDYNLANQSGADFRADLNDALAAIVTVNSGATSPSTTFAHQLWVDTANNLLKIRNSANDAWITTGVSITADNTFDINGGTVNGITSFSFSTGSTVTSILDEDDLSSDSATALATQQSIKAYVDSQVATVDTLAEILLNGNSTGGTDISLSSSDITGTGNINITGTIQSSGTITGNLTGDVTGNASTATALETARTINGVSFDGTANISFDTDSVSEGSSNLYYTTARFDSAFTGKSTSDLSEGTNLYYTDTRFDTRLATKDTDDLTEGTNLYFTNARVESYLDAGTATPTFASAVINSSLAGSAILDDDTFATASATTVATSESIKAYVDSQVGSVDTLAEILLNGNTTGGTDISLSSSDITGTGNINITGTITSDGLTVDNTSGAEVVISRQDTSLVDGDFIGGIKFGTNDSSTAYGSAPHYSAGIKAKAFGTVGLMEMHLYAGQTNDAYEEDTPSMTLHYNGDISFYEDTGTTAKFFWDASTERLGIGTSSPAQDLELNKNAANVNLNIRSSDTGSATLLLGDQGDASVASITLDNSTNDLIFKNNNQQEAMRIDSSLNVGIGTTSPAALLNIKDDVNSSIGLLIENTSAAGASSAVLDLASASQSAFRLQQYIDGSARVRNLANAPLMFYTNNTERMRIDSSGNLLVGQTSQSPNTVGVSLNNNGNISAKRDGGIVALFNRATSDGEIISIRKNDTTVGSIGTISGYLTIGTNDTGLIFNDVSNAIYPWNVGTNSASDGLLDLGFTNRRFKDLYLSGTLTNDGTGGISIDTSGRVGIGTTSPDRALHVSTSDNLPVFVESTDGLSLLGIGDSSGTVAVAANGSSFSVYTGGEVGGSTSFGSEAMRIDSSGNLLVGHTDRNTIVSNGSSGVCLGYDGFIGASRTSEVLVLNREDSDGTIATFRKDGTTVGSISVTGSATAYNTSSDARLKDVTGEARGLEVITKLNPVAYNWKADGKADEGLIAQEVKEIVPNAVSGSEDEHYQMDYSKLVTPLVKAIQEQQEQIESLKSEIAKLKGE